MDWTWYLFGFQGRINRAKYWLAGLVMLGWALFVVWTIFLFLRLAVEGYLPVPHSFQFGAEEIFAILDPATYHLPSRADVIPLFANVIGTPVLLWIYLATSIKRLHDRDKSGWWMVPFVVAPVLYEHFADRLPDSMLSMLPGVAVIVLSVWGWIEMACLKGTASTNRFGANPLGKQQSRPRSDGGRGFRLSGWDQHSEIELVPHRASAPDSNIRVPPR
jgi:uncharacterized membrane protein YhaH (DUF805 family)